jgi:pyridoxamine 5'-phosphate oxidase
MLPNEFLPEPLQADPLPLFHTWFQQAQVQRAQPNPNAMVLATVGADERPSARVVLCKHVALDPGYVVFFTNYDSRKGRELAAHPHAAAVFHWDALHRQVRIEGPVSKSPNLESEAYFLSRALESRVGAWASDQSQPLASRQALADRVQQTSEQFGAKVPRPPHWGGLRLWIARIELWVEGPGRVHDRAVWQRELRPTEPQLFATSAWRATRLNP